jgi:hypothetical protein
VTAGTFLPDRLELGLQLRLLARGRSCHEFLDSGVKAAHARLEFRAAIPNGLGRLAMVAIAARREQVPHMFAVLVHGLGEALRRRLVEGRLARPSLFFYRPRGRCPPQNNPQPSLKVEILSKRLH